MIGATENTGPTMRQRKTAELLQTPEQLPFWPEDQRGMPNSLARSALFNVAHVRKGARRHMKRVRVASVSGILIEYTGEELRQDDEDVFLQCAHVARTHELGTTVSFTAGAMLAELGWTHNSESYERLRNCLDRLSATTVTVALSDAKAGFGGSLVRRFRWRDTGGAQMRMWEVELEPEIVGLFGPAHYTRLDWKLRLTLPPLAKWLHSFYHTHMDPVPYTVAKLKELTGSEAKELRQFRYKLRQALDLLVERGFFLEAKIDARTDLVMARRRPRLQALA